MKYYILLLALFATQTEPSTSSSIHGRVVGGYPAKANQFPWQAILTLCQREGQSCGTCGGSLITRNFILTAAHCTENMYYFDIGLGSNSRFQPALKLRSMIKRQHPMWNRLTLENDISLIKLPQEVELSDSIQIIPLVSADMGNLLNQSVLVSGFGKTHFRNDVSTNLNFVGLRVIENELCGKVYRMRMASSKLCAVGQAKTQTVCQGDSGGPLVIQNGSSFVQVGIVSFTFMGCIPGFPSGYTRVSRYLNWINRNMKENKI